MALDLCLSRKGCKGDCPVNVDVATYKSEFFYHYHEKKTRPPSAYAMGQIFRWANLAARFPDVANLLTQAPGVSNIARPMAGITQKRRMPAFARETFQSWFERRSNNDRKNGRANNDRPVATLWADTFNNHFFPHTAKAAVEVLEYAGYRVHVPSRHLCCGRPLFDYGVARSGEESAARHSSIAASAACCRDTHRRAEPSCASVFRDALTNLFPVDQDAQRMRQQVVTLSEFRSRADYQPPPLKRKALLHGHYHQKAIFGMKNEQRILSRMGLNAELLDSGCCGLAGSFGFEEHHYDISMKIGERVLLPRVRAAERDTLIITDGFSCREQIMHSTP